MNSEKKAVRADFLKLTNAGRYHFSPEDLDKIPIKQGVYIIYSPREHVVHVGRTYRGRKGLQQRIKNHLHGSSSFTIEYLKGRGDKLKNGYTYQYLPLKNWRRRAFLEAYATGFLCPAHIGKNQARLIS